MYVRILNMHIYPHSRFLPLFDYLHKRHLHSVVQDCCNFCSCSINHICQHSLHNMYSYWTKMPILTTLHQLLAKHKKRLSKHQAILLIQHLSINWSFLLGQNLICLSFTITETLFSMFVSCSSVHDLFKQSN